MNKLGGMPVTFVVAMCYKFQPEDRPKFMQEIADLSEEEMQEFRRMLIEDGYLVTDLKMVVNNTPTAKDDGPVYDAPAVEVSKGYKNDGKVYPAVIAQ